MNKYKTLTSNGKEAYIKALDEIGIFNLPQFDKEEVIAKVNSYTDNDYQMALYHTLIDMEDFGAEECKQLFVDIEKKANLKFSNSIFSVDDDEINIEVTLNDKTTKTSLETEYGWVNPIYITYTVNHIFYENKIDNDFLSIFPNEPEQIAYFIIIPMKLYISCINKGIINKDDDYLRSLYDEYDMSDCELE